MFMIAVTSFLIGATFGSIVLHLIRKEDIRLLKQDAKSAIQVQIIDTFASGWFEGMREEKRRQKAAVEAVIEDTLVSLTV